MNMIFSDSLNAINKNQHLTNHIYAKQIRKIAKCFVENKYQIILQWIPSHWKIIENEISDKTAKAGHSQILSEFSAITFDSLKSQIYQNTLNKWMNQSMATMQVKRQILREIRNETWQIELLSFVKQLFEIDFFIFFLFYFILFIH